MKTFASLLLISATLVGSAAYAQDNQAESLSRAQVVGELQAAKIAGVVTNGELDYPPAIEQTSSLSRAQVVAELQAAKAAGLVTHGEIEEAPVAVAGNTLTREQVRAEAVSVREHGPVAFGGAGYPDTGA